MPNNMSPDDMRRLIEEREAQSQHFSEPEQPSAPAPRPMANVTRVDVPGQSIEDVEQPVHEPGTRPNLGIAKSHQRPDPRELRDTDVHPGMELGWLPIEVTNLPTQGLFYPEGTQIAVRAANQAEIRQFSAIEEEDLSDQEEKLAYVLERCVKVKFPTGLTHFKDIKEIDRLYILFFIRDFTFKQNPTKLLMDVNCSQCGNKDQIEITKNHFDVLKLDDGIMKWYNPEKRCFSVEYAGEEYDLHIPSVGVTSFMKAYIIKKVRANEHFDRPFAFKYGSFTIGDWRQLTGEAAYNAMVMNSIKWTQNKVIVLSNFADKMKSTVDAKVHHVCSACSAEVTADLQFRLKDILIPNLSDLFS